MARIPGRDRSAPIVAVRGDIDALPITESTGLPYASKRAGVTDLPSAFKGLKIVHISDIHSGSFMDKQAVLKGVEKIIKQKPDLILFTGDLVNDRATEMKDYMDII